LLVGATLELVALETFDRALRWLRAQPEVDPDRVAVFGHSKGAEAALLVGTRDKRLRAVIASAPTSYVWPGIDWNAIWPGSADASWTANGEPLDVLPYGGFSFQAMFGDVGRLYEEGLENRSEHPDAAIAVERISDEVLLVCGEQDNLWPSCPMARMLDARAAKAGHPSVTVLAYEHAGHRVFGLPEAPSSQSLRRWGGDPAANNAARKDAWPKIVRFLDGALR
jgi:dienelactone hydrolase